MANLNSSLFKNAKTVPIIKHIAPVTIHVVFPAFIEIKFARSSSLFISFLEALLSKLLYIAVIPNNKQRTVVIKDFIGWDTWPLGGRMYKYMPTRPKISIKNPPNRPFLL